MSTDNDQSEECNGYQEKGSMSADGRAQWGGEIKKNFQAQNAIGWLRVSQSGIMMNAGRSVHPGVDVAYADDIDNR